MWRSTKTGADSRLPICFSIARDRIMTGQTNSAQQSALVDGEIRLAGGLGQRLFKLLKAIDNTGSINQAAREVGLTYKGAWEMIERANNMASTRLVRTLVGGKQGGGTLLSPAGKAFLGLFVDLEREHRQFLAMLNQRLAENQEILMLFKRSTMKVSARNQFFGAVIHVVEDCVSVTVVVELKGGETIVATITRESATDLGIAEGIEVMALVKAPQIMLVTDFGGYRLSARNQLQGKVARIHQGEITGEVVVELKGGDSVAATVTDESLGRLGLAEGSPVTVVFKSGAVMLAVPA